MDYLSSPEIGNLIQLALKREQTGDVSGALRLAREALNIARSNNLPLDYALALTAVARYRFRLGQYETARGLAQAAMEMTDPLQDGQAAVHAEALLLLGMCALETYSIAECEQYYHAASNLAREIGNSMLFQRARHNLASGVYLFRGQFDLAIATDCQSLQICREKEYSDWAVFPLMSLAIAYQITGQRAHTRETLAELYALAQPGSGGEGYACYVSGMLALDEDDFQNAYIKLSQALTLAEKLGDPSLNLDARLGISRLCRLRGEIAKSLGWAEDALNFAQRVGYRIYQGRARVEHGRAMWLAGDRVGAENYLLQAEAIFLEMDLRYDLTEVRLLLTAIYHQQKDARVAERLPQVSAAVLGGGYGFLLDRERSLMYSLAAHINDPIPEVARAAAVLLAEIQRIPPRPLRVKTLGSFVVWVGAQMVEARILRQRRAGELLALLLSSPGYTLSAEQICEAMCLEKDPVAAVDFYHHAISALRRLLEPDLPDRRFPSRYLEVSEERITLLVPPDSSIDFLIFEQHIQKKDWEQGIALYLGEFLPLYRYAEWTITLREHYSDLFEKSLLARASDALTAGDPAVCLEISRKALLQNPWQEQAVELGMRAALELGDRVTALKLYQRLEKKLSKDLGITPQKELLALYKVVLERSRDP